MRALAASGPGDVRSKILEKVLQDNAIEEQTGDLWDYSTIVQALDLPVREENTKLP